MQSAAHSHGVKVRDPVCGMSVDPATTRHHHTWDGGTHHFCSGRCRDKFAADPEKYLAADTPAPRRLRRRRA